MGVFFENEGQVSPACGPDPAGFLRSHLTSKMILTVGEIIFQLAELIWFGKYGKCMQMSQMRDFEVPYIPNYGL